MRLQSNLLPGRAGRMLIPFGVVAIVSIASGQARNLVFFALAGAAVAALSIGRRKFMQSDLGDARRERAWARHRARFGTPGGETPESEEARRRQLVDEILADGDDATD